MNTARMQALDKVTGQMKVIDVPVNGMVEFGSFSVVVRNCQSTPPEETPEDYAFVDVADKNKEGSVFNIFKGWMVSSSPSLNSVEHPIYDVWLLDCINTDNNINILSPEQLAERDAIEKQKAVAISKEAKIAKKLQKQQKLIEEMAKAEQEELNRQQQEAEEEKARQKELESEIEHSKELLLVEESQDAEGPVSLLNFDKNKEINNNSDNSENNDFIDAKPVDILVEIIPDDKVSSETVSSEKTSVEESNEATSEEEPNEANIEEALPIPSVDGLVIIEDTHHETVPQDIGSNEKILIDNPLLEEE